MPFTLTRFHRTRLMQIWRSAGWPCKDALEIDLLAAQLIALHVSPDGCETLRLTEAGIRTLAEARQRGVRALSGHDRLGQRFAAHLLAAGRIVWRELSLRAAVEGELAVAVTPSAAAVAASPAEAKPASQPLWSEDTPATRAAANVWRMARPDLFSVRNTTVPAYLQPQVHEIKYTRADLLSDLRHEAKRRAYQWLCEECYYVFPAGVAEADEIPEHFGVWVLHGGLDEGRFELLRPARHSSCTLPFAVWMALCKATPLRTDEESGQQSHLGAPEAAAALAALEIPAEGSDAAPSDIPPVPEATSPLDSGPAGTPPPCPGTT